MFYLLIGYFFVGMFAPPTQRESVHWSKTLDQHGQYQSPEIKIAPESGLIYSKIDVLMQAT